MLLDWREFIEVNEEVEAGKPVIRNTRLTVEFVLGLLANGWSVKDIVKHYPKLKETDIQAVFAFLFEGARNGFFFSTPKI